MRIAIIDYGMGNLRSIYKAFNKVGEKSFITSDYKDLNNCDKIVLPGVGHFKQGISNLKKMNLFEPLKELVEIKEAPILGICLGMQLMAKTSEEGDGEGFGWIDSKVVQFKINNFIRYKIPQMGWNTLKLIDDNEPLFNGINSYDEFYFVHSYHLSETKKNQILAKTRYEYDFVSAVKKNNIVGYQFHHEKSHDAGYNLIKNFLFSYYD